VIAEVTLSHLIRLADEQGRPVSRQQALKFLNEEGQAFEMWKHMMQAARSSSQSACSGIPLALENTGNSRHAGDRSKATRALAIFGLHFRTRRLGITKAQYQN